MNKKLLLSTALASSIALAGVASAKISGDFTHTINFGSDEGTATGTNSGTQLGSEVNIYFDSERKELKNGMFAHLKGKLEIDDETNDQEYELQIGSGNFYVGIGSDGGNNPAAAVLPYLGYIPGTLAQHVSNYTAESSDYLASMEGADANHISANINVAGGTATVRYAPSTDSTNDDSRNLTNTGGSVTEFLYSGSPIKGLKLLVAQTEQNNTTQTGSNEQKNRKYAVAYNFGQFAAGVERQDLSDDLHTAGEDEQSTRYAVSFAATDAITLGVTYTETEDENTAATVDEEITTLEVGYNLGGLSVIASYVKAEGMGFVNNQDADGIVLRTKMSF